MLTRCPHCFVQLPPQLYAFRCTDESCPEEVDLPLSEHRGSEERGRTVVTLPGQSQPPHGAACPRCTRHTSTEVCPECHYELLPGWRNCTTTCFALAGARASGKSIYIGVLVKQAEMWCERHGKTFAALDPRTREMFKRIYETPLYEKRGLIPPTPSAQIRLAPQREPLLFDMGNYHNRNHVLVIRDVAGEDLEDATTAALPFRFYSRADVVAFLFDPLRLADVRGQLEGLVSPHAIQGGDPMDVLRNLVRLMRGGAAFGAPLATPLALVLAKFDTLEELARVEHGSRVKIMGNRGATFNLDPSAGWPFDRADALKLQAEVESLLITLNVRALLNMIKASFSDWQLFAVSALGTLPFDAATVSARGIAPYRVMDPLKWALARTGLIPVS